MIRSGTARRSHGRRSLGRSLSPEREGADYRLVKKWKSLTTGRPFLLKGIQCAEDAIKAIECGCDGVIVSNHAGRQVDGAIGSLEALPEVSRAVYQSWFSALIPRLSRVCWPLPKLCSHSAIGDKGTVLFDSGVRTGADVFKALALGAKAVCVGRLYSE